MEYKKVVQKALFELGNLSILEGEVTGLKIKCEKIVGVKLAEVDYIGCKALILTTGTFLNGVIHIGDKSFSGGRNGDSASLKLAEQINDFGLAMGRLKTGTPPRLLKESINWKLLEKQYGDTQPSFFSFSTQNTSLRQTECHITHTNEKTHKIIEENLHRSAIYNGNISSAGPRYCPSIEDKVVRFLEKESHQIFLEPEGLESDLI